MVEQAICQIKDLTEQQIVELCSRATSITPAVIVLIMTLLFFTIFGLMFVKKNRGKLALIIVLTTLFSVAILIWLLLSPHLVNTITQFFVGIK